MIANGEKRGRDEEDEINQDDLRGIMDETKKIDVEKDEEDAAMIASVNV